MEPDVTELLVVRQLMAGKPYVGVVELLDLASNDIPRRAAVEALLFYLDEGVFDVEDGKVFLN